MTSRSTEVKEIDTDVLVIGGGSAGLWAAIRASDFCPRVTLVDKGIVASSGISTFCHVYAAPVPEEDLKPAMREIVERSAYLCDQTRLEILLRELGDRVRQMESWGVPFEKDSSGKLFTDKRMGQKVTTCVFVSGRELMLALRQHALTKGVDLVERVMVTDLLTSDGQHPTTGRVAGAVGFHTITGNLQIFKAKAVIISSGLVGAKLHIQYADGVTGDGQAMAFRAGAELSGMEMGSNPGFSLWGRKFATGGQAEYMRAGAKLVNNLGEEIIQKYAPDKKEPFLTRIQLCGAAAKEALEGRGPVYMDMRHFSQKDIELLRRILPSAMKAFDDAGIDLRERPVEITPIVPFFFGGGEGGIKIGRRKPSFSLPSFGKVAGYRKLKIRIAPYPTTPVT